MNLRKLSPRPTLVVDNRQWRLVDATGSDIGISGPLGRARCVYALPTDGGPDRHAWFMVRPPYLFADPHGNLVGVSADVLLGRDVIWVARMMTARWTEDTRRQTL